MHSSTSAMPRAQEEQHKVTILKKTTGFCPSRYYFSMMPTLVRRGSGGPDPSWSCRHHSPTKWPPAIYQTKYPCIKTQMRPNWRNFSIRQIKYCYTWKQSIILIIILTAYQYVKRPLKIKICRYGWHVLYLV